MFMLMGSCMLGGVVGIFMMIGMGWLVEGLVVISIVWCCCNFCGG